MERTEAGALLFLDLSLFPGAEERSMREGHRGAKQVVPNQSAGT